MNDKDLINRIQILKQVKPSKTWVSFAKAEILSGIPEEELGFNWRKFNLAEMFSFPVLKPVAVSLVVMIFASVLGGMFWLTKISVPGQKVYIVKLTYQNLRVQLTAAENQPEVYLTYAQQKIDGDLGKAKEETDSEKRDEKINEAVKVATNDFSNATTTLKKITEPSKKMAAGVNFVKQASAIEKSLALAKGKENLSAESQEKISEVEKLAKETKEEVFASLMVDSEDNSQYREMVENLQKEVEEYEKQYREQYPDSLGK